MSMQNANCTKSVNQTCVLLFSLSDDVGQTPHTKSPIEGHQRVVSLSLACFTSAVATEPLHYKPGGLSDVILRLNDNDLHEFLSSASPPGGGKSKLQ